MRDQAGQIRDRRRVDAEPRRRQMERTDVDVYRTDRVAERAGDRRAERREPADDRLHDLQPETGETERERKPQLDELADDRRNRVQDEGPGGRERRADDAGERA